MMIVITLTDCPVSLRGDLSKWLIEINTGVFVGKVSARVRDNLWERVRDNIKSGKATLVYNTDNEQRMNFRLHNSENQIIDFDGLKLVMKPSVSRIKTLGERRRGFSNAAKRRMGQKRKQLSTHKKEITTIPALQKTYPESYIVLDLETTGLRVKFNEILEIGMLKICNGAITASFQSILHVKKIIPAPVEKLTGITKEMTTKMGKNLEDVLPQVREFIGEECLVGHNITFDLNFLNQAFQKQNENKIMNPSYDTMKMYAEHIGKSYRKSLKDISEKLGIKEKPTHRALQDCKVVKAVYEILKKQ